VKMRKDMIPGLGDTADLVVIGARRDMNCGMLAWWTTFYLVCVDNKAESEDRQSLPSFTIVATVSRPAITTADIRYPTDTAKRIIHPLLMLLSLRAFGPSLQVILRLALSSCVRSWSRLWARVLTGYPIRGLRASGFHALSRCIWTARIPMRQPPSNMCKWLRRA
ncbi:uncharacterized protein HMPREF1541_10953, partial [Cyphellophora europaea CBS 101466]